MERQISLTAIIEKEGNEYVSFCPELDIASQGKSATEAKQNLVEALELFLNTLQKRKYQLDSIMNLRYPL